jgi:hypothetical protein
MTFFALKYYSILRQRQFVYSNAINFAEEGYNLVVEAYDCVYFKVQEAAGILIDVLMILKPCLMLKDIRM